MEITGNHLKAARALVGLDQDRLSELSGVSINTVRNMEASGDQQIGGYASTRDKVQQALETLGIEFTNGNSPGVRLARRGGEAAGASKGASPSRTPSRRKVRQKPSRRRRKSGG